MFIRIAPTTLVNTDQIVGVVIRDGEIHFDCINRIYKIGSYDPINDPVWKYFESIAMTPGEGKSGKWCDPIVRDEAGISKERLAQEFFEYVRHFSSCQIDIPKGIKCDCGFDHIMRLVQSILEQSE